jgi:hypothetical protein
VDAGSHQAGSTALKFELPYYIHGVAGLYLYREVLASILSTCMIRRGFIPGIDQALEAVVDGSSPSIVGISDSGTTVSLLELCSTIFLRGTTTAFLGHDA